MPAGAPMSAPPGGVRERIAREALALCVQVDALAAQFPSVQNWDIIAPSLERAAVPNHEYDFPNFARGQQRFSDFRTLLYGDTGATIDLEAEIDRLEADLQAIVDEEG